MKRVFCHHKTRASLRIVTVAVCVIIAVILIRKKMIASELERNNDAYSRDATQHDVTHPLSEKSNIPFRVSGDREEILGDPYELFTLSTEQLNVLTAKRHRTARLDSDDTIHPITHEGTSVSFVAFAPKRTMVGFFYHPDSDTTFTTALAIMDVSTRHIVTVYRGVTPRTSGWEWKDNDHVFVYRNCGTACRMIEVIDVNTGERIDSYHDIEYERRVIEAWCDDPCPLLEQYDAEQARVK